MGCAPMTSKALSMPEQVATAMYPLQTFHITTVVTATVFLNMFAMPALREIMEFHKTLPHYTICQGVNNSIMQCAILSLATTPHQLTHAVFYHTTPCFTTPYRTIRGYICASLDFTIPFGDYLGSCF